MKAKCNLKIGLNNYYDLLEHGLNSYYSVAIGQGVFFGRIGKFLIYNNNVLGQSDASP